MRAGAARGHLIRGLIAYCAEHTPLIYDDGSSCDEHDCGVCNEGAEEYAQQWFARVHASDPYTPPLPGREELARAFVEHR